MAQLCPGFESAGSYRGLTVTIVPRSARPSESADRRDRQAPRPSTARTCGGSGCAPSVPCEHSWSGSQPNRSARSLILTPKSLPGLRGGVFVAEGPETPPVPGAGTGAGAGQSLRRGREFTRTRSPAAGASSLATSDHTHSQRLDRNRFLASVRRVHSASATSGMGHATSQ